ncbi:MAG: YbaK/EbsC family protein [Erysipelotrichales bacterium]|nr:MAG: YbaK/EbsC family protein [Erysipelotrichales bacterium]
MAIDAVKEYFAQFDMTGRIVEFEGSSATVELAAQALGVASQRIAKTLSFRNHEGCLLVVAAGDAKVDNAKFKQNFGMKARMLTPDEALQFTGHAVGGICPFAIPTDVPVYLDASLKRFSTVFPACGSSNSCIELTLPELSTYANSDQWIDVCKDWHE